MSGERRRQSPCDRVAAMVKRRNKLGRIVAVKFYKGEKFVSYLEVGSEYLTEEKLDKAIKAEMRDKGWDRFEYVRDTSKKS